VRCTENLRTLQQYITVDHPSKDTIKEDNLILFVTFLFVNE